MLKAKLFSLQIGIISSTRGTCTGPKTKEDANGRYQMQVGS